MYTQSIIHFPLPTKIVELRTALLERNDAANAGGTPHSLSVSMFTPEIAFIHRLRFESLAAIEAYQDKQRQDAGFAAAMAKVSPCLARAQSGVLHEELIMTPAPGAGAPPKFSIANRVCPSAGNVGEVRARIEERISKPQPGVLGVRLGIQVGSPDGPAYRVQRLFASMAAIDEFRAAEAADPSARDYYDTIASLCRVPGQQRWNRILSPFPRK